MSFAKCQWAACSRLAAVMEDGWYHCGRHLREHRDQRDHVTRDTPIREQIPALHAQGLNDRQIAQKLGTDPHYVGNLRRELGLNRVQPVPEGHGTRWGYAKHKAAQEEPCAHCSSAQSLYDSERYLSRRAKASV